MKKKFMSLALSFCLSAAVMPNAMAQSNEITVHVAEYGSDVWGNGGEYRPYASVEKGLAKAKELMKSGTKKDIKIIFGGGEYLLKETISIDYLAQAGYSGKLTFAAKDGEKVSFLGAEKSGEWENVGGGIYRTKQDEEVNVVFENGQNAIKARYPNRGEKRSDGYLSAAADGTDYVLYFGEGDFPEPQNTADLQVYLFAGGPSIIYAVDNPKVTADFENHSLTLASATTNNSKIKTGSRYFMQNALEFLDSPGEMYYDSTNSYLYYMPHNAADINDIYIPKIKTAVSISGRSDVYAKNVEFSGIEFKYFDTNTSARSSKYVIELRYTENITLTDCAITDSAAGGIYAYCSNGGNIIGNRIENVGGGGIQLQGESDADGDFTMTDNYIKNIGFYRADTSGIAVQSMSRNTITHNNISDVPRSAIIFGSGACQVWKLLGTTVDGTELTRDNIKPYLLCNDNVIAYNDCSQAMKETNDGGIIYSWGAGYDNKIIGNYFHDTDQEFSFGWVIYMDDDTSRTEISGNFVKDCGKNGEQIDIVIVKGQNNVVTNNLFVNCDYEHAMARVDSQSGAGPVGNATFTKNIFYNCGDTMFGFYSYSTDGENNRLKKCDNNVYFDRTADDFGIKIRNSNDQFVKTISKSAWQNTYGKDSDSYFGYPGFEDVYGADYRMNDAKYGFKNIDFTNFGLTKNYKYINGGAAKTIFVRTAKSTDPMIFMNAGDEDTLSVAVRDENGMISSGAKIGYYSSDESVATVENGKIKAVASGRTLITVTAQKGDTTLSAELYVDVY